MKKFITGLLIILSVFILSGCAFFNSAVNDMNGYITGNTYSCDFYSNSGEKFMEMNGTRISLSPNIVREEIYTDSGWGYTKTVSSVVTVTIDGHQVESCGSTILFKESGLNAEVEFDQSDVQINSTADSVGDIAIVSRSLNKYKNAFGKPTVVLIQSQLGDPICAFSGNEVYWEVREDLPKTTKIMIDGKALYIHRANFQIIDKALLN